MFTAVSSAGHPQRSLTAIEKFEIQYYHSRLGNQKNCRLTGSDGLPRSSRPSRSSELSVQRITPRFG
jgi:hypothetical protein